MLQENGVLSVQNLRPPRPHRLRALPPGRGLSPVGRQGLWQLRPRTPRTPPEQGPVEWALFHQFFLRSPPAIREKSAGRGAEVIDDASILHQERTASVSVLNDPKMVAVLGQIKVAFGAFALIQIEPGGDRSQRIRREYDLTRPAAAVTAAAAVAAIARFRFKLGGGDLIHCLCPDSNRSGRSRADQDGG